MFTALIQTIILVSITTTVSLAHIQAQKQIDINRTPRVSIITSLYKGEQFIEGFMRDIIQQTIFHKCELIIINANSPENEEPIIQRYLARYPNIKYIRLDYDPGIYGVWNMAIELARSPYITNANVDDRLRYDCYQEHAYALDKHPLIDLVYSDCFVTKHPNETFRKNSAHGVQHFAAFSIKEMHSNLPHNHPMWRKSLHEKYGYFDATYKSAGDWEMWLRAVKGGSQFLKTPGIYSLYYHNPKGLSTDAAKMPLIRQEVLAIKACYSDFLASNS